MNVPYIHGGGRVQQKISVVNDPQSENLKRVLYTDVRYSRICVKPDVSPPPFK